MENVKENEVNNANETNNAVKKEIGGNAMETKISKKHERHPSHVDHVKKNTPAAPVKKMTRKETLVRVIGSFLRKSKNGRTMKEIQEYVLSKPDFASLSPLTIYTFVMDGKNPKYSAFHPNLKKDKKTGLYTWAGKEVAA